MDVPDAPDGGVPIAELHPEPTRGRERSDAPLYLLSLDALDRLIVTLRHDGFRTYGPVVRGGAIVIDEIAGAADLPRGTMDEQDAGRYRLAERSDGALFGYAAGPHSLKAFTFVPRLRLLHLRRRARSFEVLEAPAEAPRVAVIGARACDLAALAVQDRVFLRGGSREPDYAERRRALFLVAVHCTEPGGTCFCASMGTGPRATGGFDLALTELPGAEPRFVAEAGSEAGSGVVQRLGLPQASESDRSAAETRIEDAIAHMGRHLDTGGIRDLLLGNLEHPQWDDVAARCLGCTNCTMVCPTCFCSTVEDTTDLSGGHAERWRRWDSCFTLEHSHVHGGSVRASLRARYRQWLTHKLASWIDQFGVSGCVGCGRCITWCPAAIDITREVAAIRTPRNRGAS